MEDHEHDSDTLIMDKVYKGHHIHMLATLQDGDWNVIAQCVECQVHMYLPKVEFSDEDCMLFVDAEFQMHSFGIEDGWHKGYGFML